MEKRKINLLVGIILILLVGRWTLCVSAAETFEIEQIQENMPELVAYIRSEEKPQVDNLEAWLEEDKLVVRNIEKFGDTDKGTDYFVLVDVSNSMPDIYCESIKEALTDFSAGIEENDKMILLAFGEEVTTLLAGGEDEETRKQAIMQLHNEDNRTLLFEAIQTTADMADKLQDDSRKIVLVISDGENFAIGASTSEEAKTALSNRNMPVYAMGIGDTDKENLNKFGETARALGGTLTVFKADETIEALKEMQQEWENTWIVTLSAENNRVDNQIHTVSIKIPSSGITRSKEIVLAKYQPDDTVPQIISVEKTAERKLQITFSEKVVGAENGASWSVVYEEENLPVMTAAYVDKEKNIITLTLEKSMYTGNYQISAPGVTDDSMEENRLEGVFEIELEGIEPEVVIGLPAWKVWLQNWWWVILAAVLGVVLLVIICIWRKIEKNKGIVFVNGKASLVKNVEKKQHISLEQEDGFPIILELLGVKKGNKNRIEAVIQGSMIVGRASICDLSLEDGKMSRQHFALEYRDGNVLITDLQTMNGTTVNGVVIRNSHKLSHGDVIAAGSLQMRITW